MSVYVPLANRMRHSPSHSGHFHTPGPGLNSYFTILYGGSHCINPSTLHVFCISSVESFPNVSSWGCSSIVAAEHQAFKKWYFYSTPSCSHITVLANIYIQYREWVFGPIQCTSIPFSWGRSCEKALLLQQRPPFCLYACDELRKVGRVIVHCALSSPWSITSRAFQQEGPFSHHPSVSETITLHIHGPNGLTAGTECSLSLLLMLPHAPSLYWCVSLFTNFLLFSLSCNCMLSIVINRQLDC